MISPPDTFDFALAWPASDASSLPQAVKALIDCPHPHHFLVRQDDNGLMFNKSGATCLSNAGILQIEAMSE